MDIDAFLKLMKKSVESGIEVTSKMVYGNLTRIGTSNYNPKTISNNFTDWISHFHSKQNIKVFVDPKRKYFCQFTNDKNQKPRYKR